MIGEATEERACYLLHDRHLIINRRSAALDVLPGKTPKGILRHNAQQRATLVRGEDHHLPADAVQKYHAASADRWRRKLHSDHRYSVTNSMVLLTRQIDRINGSCGVECRSLTARRGHLPPASTTTTGDDGGRGGDAPVTLPGFNLRLAVGVKRMSICATSLTDWRYQTHSNFPPASGWRRQTSYGGEGRIFNQQTNSKTSW